MLFGEEGLLLEFAHRLRDVVPIDGEEEFEAYVVGEMSYLRTPYLYIELRVDRRVNAQRA